MLKVKFQLGERKKGESEDREAVYALPTVPYIAPKDRLGPSGHLYLLLNGFQRKLQIRTVFG